ncbi:MAG: hypothetical protein KGQ83_00915 [Planctomycetes bacterium]|nr:hypothetical protein [Planctomycetota bacterium]
MPLSGIRGIATEKQWTNFFENLIKPSVENSGLGFRCTRSSADVGNLLKRIIHDLDSADVVIADLTGQNANVFYELGVRHALRGRTILLAQDRKYIPFDITSYACHVYDWKTDEGRRQFQETIQKLLICLEEHPERSDNPVEDFLRDRSERVLLLLHASRLPTKVQREAADAFMKEYANKLRSIERGEIPIPGGHGGYFNTFLEIIEKGSKKEEAKIFASLRPLELGGGFAKFNRAGLFARLAGAVKAGKLQIEYIIFLSSADALKKPEVKTLLSEYKSFAYKVKVAFADQVTVPQVEIERTIALMTKRRWAFTHTWSPDGDVLIPTQWISEEDYVRLASIYERVKLQSQTCP